MNAVRAAYIHIPFCSHICYYCDFKKVFIEGQPVDEYVDLLVREMQLRAEAHPISPLETLYIGGGTPSTLTPKQLATLFEGIHRYLPLEKNCEFSMELNPDDGQMERLEVMKEYGVNRISMGVQSFNDELLKKIGRKHSKKTVLQTIGNARKLGFENISIDLIFRLPQQTIQDFEDSLKIAMELDLPHYSIYSLILEQKTVFYNLMRQGKLPLPSQDEEADMFQLAMDSMESFGRHHYEISNYALPGFESRHNLHYWKADEYLGFGAGELPVLQKDVLSKKSQIEEFMFLGLRKMSGVSNQEFFKRFGKNINDIYQEIIEDLLDQELIQLTAEGIALTHKGKFLGNNVFQAFLLEE